MTRREASQTIIRECFWGDYKITADDIVRSLAAGDSPLTRLIVSKIVDSASRPSGLLRVLMDHEGAREVIHHLAFLPGTRRDKRIKLVRGNLLGEEVDIPELSWER